MAHRKVKSSLLMSALMFFCAADVLVAALEPEEYGFDNSDGTKNVRGLRDDYVRTWHIFGDEVTDGILNPGDKKLDSFKNWWTPKSASTQHNYRTRGWPVTDDYASDPNSHRAFPPGGDESYYLPGEKNTIAFYMTYAQLDNADFDGPGNTGYNFRWESAADQAMFQQRNMERNAWAIAWLTNEMLDDKHDKTADHVGNVKMDVFVHNGKSSTSQGTDVVDYADRIDPVISPNPPTYTYEKTTRSNPHVSLSNDIDVLAEVSPSGDLEPPDYLDNGVGNTPDDGYAYTGLNDKVYGSPGDLATVVASMEVREVDPGYEQATDPLDTHAIHGDKTPWDIYDSLTDGNGNKYEYQDAFYNRAGTDADPSLSTGAPYVEGSTDGGVIVGLSGYSDYDPGDPENLDWGEQQVIRIDFDASTFDTITQVKFYDFGEKGGSSQIDPRVITFSWSSNPGLFYDANGDGTFDPGDDYLMPDNRIYIAVVTNIPEPSTFALVMLGGLGALAHKRMRRRRR